MKVDRNAHVLIKDWSKPNGRIIKKGTTLTLDHDLFKRLEVMGIAALKTFIPLTPEPATLQEARRGLGDEEE